MVGEVRQDVLDHGPVARGVDEPPAQRVEALGHTDGGEFTEMPEWYPADASYDDLGAALFEETMLPNRPR